MAESSVVGEIEAGVSDAVEANQKVLGDETAALVSKHQERAGRITDRVILRYFGNQQGEPITPESLAILHYLESGNKDLPGQDELAPRIEAAEAALETIGETDMLLAPNNNGSIITLAKRDAREVTLYPRDMVATKTGFTGAELELPGERQRRVPAFSLISYENLVTPITTAGGVNSLFRRRRQDIRDAGQYRLTARSFLPLIAGGSAITRFAINLGVHTPLKDIETAVESGRELHFSGLTATLAKTDHELGNVVLQEVRERRPKAVAAIQRALREDVDWELSYVIEHEGEGDPEHMRWFKRSDVQLFYTAEELEEVKEELMDTHRTALDKDVTDLEKRVARRTAAFAKVLKS